MSVAAISVPPVGTEKEPQTNGAMNTVLRSRILRAVPRENRVPAAFTLLICFASRLRCGSSALKHLMTRLDQKTGGKSISGEGSRWSVPNLLSAIRLICAPGLLALAGMQLPEFFLWTFTVLLLTDWLDGRIARWSGQETTFGARLDSIADVTTYVAVLLGSYWLKPDLIGAEVPLILIAAGSYVFSIGVCVLRFRRLPTYHTLAAKLCWALTGLGIIFVLLSVSVWPLRVAMGAIMAANLEATAITLLIPHWRANVPTLYHALGRRNREEGADGQHRSDDLRR